MPTFNAMSDYLESGVLTHIFGGASFTKPSTIAVALTSNIPTDSATGASMFEVANAGSYARQTLNPSDTNWEYRQESGSGTIRNLATITFPQATVAWGHVSGSCIVDNATYGAGNVLFRGSVELAKFVDVNDQIVISPSGLVFRLS